MIKIYALMIKEFYAIWFDKRSRLMIILPLFLQLVVFSFAATMEVKNADIAILDNDRSQVSQDLIRKFRGSTAFRNIYYVSNETELDSLLEEQKVAMGVNIRQDFSKNLFNDKSSSIQVLLDGRQTNVAQILYRYSFSIVESYNNEMAVKNGMANYPKAEMLERNWYNPNIDYIWFTVTSLIGILSMLMAMLLTSLSIAREREFGTFDQLIVSPLTSFEILIGKTIPPLVIAILEATIIFVAAVFCFKISFVGNFLVLLLCIAVFLLSIVGVGLFISSICKTQQQAILGSFAFIMPAVLLSGYITPVENMPTFLQYITNVNPLKFFLVIVKGIFFKHMSFDIIFMNIVPMLIVAMITLSLANWVFNKKLD